MATMNSGKNSLDRAPTGRLPDGVTIEAFLSDNYLSRLWGKKTEEEMQAMLEGHPRPTDGAR